MTLFLQKKVSIITPFYNSMDFFPGTFSSVVGQTFSNWEWIIVDDCSELDQFNQLYSMVKDDSRITLIRCAKNGGTAVARNTALKKSTGQYIVFLDSDDQWDPDFLEKQVSFLEHNGPIVTASYRRQAKNSCTDFVVPERIDYKKLLGGGDLSCLTTMYDASIIGERLFPENMKKCEDYVFWLNILREGFVVAGNLCPLATYYIHSNSKSANKVRLIKYMYYVYHKTQNFNVVHSWYCVIRWAFYGLKKYRNVR